MKWLFLLPLAAAMASAQTPPATAQASPANAAATPEVQQYVAREFGADFQLMPEFPPIYADFNRDGQEDLLVVGTSKGVMMHAADRGYKVIDPYDAFFGFGDPKYTQDFAPSTVPGPPRFLAIAHSWRAATPLAKFVVINLPFEKLELSKTLIKKKRVDAIAAQDATGVTGFVFWTGRKYRYEPGGGM